VSGVFSIIALIGGIKILKQKRAGRKLILISCFAGLLLFIPNLVLERAVIEITGIQQDIFSSFLNIVFFIWNIAVITILFQKKVKDNLR
jgi:hypothetical protein